MYAIVKAGGRQEKVTVGETITVDRIDSAAGSSVTFPAVLLVDGAGVNNIGTLNPIGLSGALAGLRVVCDTGLSADESAFVNSSALRLYASAAARLQDENIINLSKDYSVYMYASIAHETPAAIVPIV